MTIPEIKIDRPNRPERWTKRDAIGNLIAFISREAEDVADAERFVAELVPPMRRPQRLVDRFLTVLDFETVTDVRIFDALDIGDYQAAGELLRRRARFAERFDALADRTEELDRHYDELPHRPSLGALRGVA